MNPCPLGLTVPKITVRGRQAEYAVVKRRARGYTYLGFRDGAVLEVVAPKPKSLDVEAVTSESDNWVLRHLEELF